MFNIIWYIQIHKWGFLRVSKLQKSWKCWVSVSPMMKSKSYKLRSIQNMFSELSGYLNEMFTITIDNKSTKSPKLCVPCVCILLYFCTDLASSWPVARTRNYMCPGSLGMKDCQRPNWTRFKRLFGLFGPFSCKMSAQNRFKSSGPLFWLIWD